MATQVAVKLPPELVAAMDELVKGGRFESRSQAIRAGLDLVVQRARREVIDRAFVHGFEAAPELSDELVDARRLAVDAIEAEPWERWW